VPWAAAARAAVAMSAPLAVGLSTGQTTYGALVSMGALFAVINDTADAYRILLWPESWHTRVGDRLAEAVEDTAGYVRCALGADEDQGSGCEAAAGSTANCRPYAQSSRGP
jgi:hypothetical protein